MSSLRPVSGTPERILALLRDWDAATDPDPLEIATSGSTGRPKRVVLSRAAMRASAAATRERLGGPGRWALTLPPTYVAGVQVLYRSVRDGTDPLLSTDGLDALDAGEGRCYVSLVPTQLHRALARADGAGLARFDAVLVGGGALAPELWERARARGLRVVRTYGMSETCGGCVYDGRPLAGVEVQVGADDEVLVRGPMLFDGYAGDPVRTARALRDGWLHTGDTGRLDPDGRLRVTGRLDEVINTGGVKVPPGAVADRLRDHPDVEDVAVLGVEDAEWGQRVVAYVVGPIDRDSARAWVAATLPRSWAPRDVVRLEALPLLANGKVDRQALRERA